MGTALSEYREETLLPAKIMFPNHPVEHLSYFNLSLVTPDSVEGGCITIHTVK